MTSSRTHTTTLRRAAVSALLAFSLTCCELSHAQVRMPVLQAESLASVSVSLPRDLPGEKTLVLMGFEFDHQRIMDTWVHQMNLKRDARPWVQLHMIPSVWGLIGGFVNARKRPYFPDAYQRERVIPMYTDVSAALTAMAFADSRNQVLISVVRRDGMVLARAEGHYDAERAATLLAALAE
jgi:hypothetical protein